MERCCLMYSASIQRNKICLDQAATSFPKPACVAAAVTDYIMNIGSNISRGSYESAYEAEGVVFETRQLLCTLFDWDDPACVIFTPNITTSLNWVIKGLLCPGDHVLVSSMEHNAVMRPLNQLKDRGISFDRIGADHCGRMDLASLEALVKPQTKALICTHASNVNGVLAPMKELGDFCKTHGIFFIADTAQSAGRCPVSMKEMGISALAFTGHKGLMGPQGTGGLIVTRDLASRMDPLISGGTGSFSHTELIPDSLPDRFEPGTPNIPGIYGLHAALKWIRQTGLKTIFEKEYSLFRQLKEGIETLPGVRIIGCPEADSAGYAAMPVLSVQVPGRDIALIAAALDEKAGIQTRVGLHCAPAAHHTLGTFPEGTLRFSPGYFNTASEISLCIETFRQILEQA